MDWSHPWLSEVPTPGLLPPLSHTTKEQLYENEFVVKSPVCTYVERALYLRDQDLGPGPSSAFDVLCDLR